LSAAEVAILSRLPALIGSVGADADDPAPGRLHPDAYRDDAPGSLELIRLTKDDLAAGRNADLEVFAGRLTDSVDGVSLSESEAEAWLRVLGSARIVLASRRGLFDVDDLSAVSVEDPDVALVNLLGAYQQDLAEALLSGMRQT
jgi:hypothetical protein